jgi:hypothetical protein
LDDKEVAVVAHAVEDVKLHVKARRSHPVLCRQVWS